MIVARRQQPGPPRAAIEKKGNESRLPEVSMFPRLVSDGRLLAFDIRHWRLVNACRGRRVGGSYCPVGLIAFRISSGTAAS